jgi:hypothetical protein
MLTVQPAGYMVGHADHPDMRISEVNTSNSTGRHIGGSSAYCIFERITRRYASSGVPLTMPRPTPEMSRCPRAASTWPSPSVARPPAKAPPAAGCLADLGRITRGHRGRVAERRDRRSRLAGGTRRRIRRRGRSRPRGTWRCDRSGAGRCRRHPRGSRAGPRVEAAPVAGEAAGWRAAWLTIAPLSDTAAVTSRTVSAGRGRFQIRCDPYT